jgi:hypothetical protein
MGMGQKDSVRARAVELGRLKDRYEALRRAARAPQRRRFFAAVLDLVLIVCLPRMIAAIVVLILAALLPFILGFALSTLFQSWSSLVFGYEEIESRTYPDRASGTKVLPNHELIALRSAALKFRKVQAEFAETAN